MTSKERLRNFIQKNLNGGCKMLSLGDDCVCPLCDFDRLVEEIDRLLKELEEASSVIEMFRLRAEKAEAELEKYKAFWEWSRQADKMTFETYDYKED